jgi:hypothetical protein
VGESEKQGFQLSFNRFLRVGFQGSRVTSNGGLILVRELDERLGLGELMERYLTDRRANNARFSFADLLRQSVYSRSAGYEDVNDAERLSHDPTFRLIGSEKIWDRGAALTSRLQSFETELLAEEENFAGLARLNRELIGKAEALDSPYRVVLDMDSTEIPVYGEQEQSAYNLGNLWRRLALPSRIDNWSLTSLQQRLVKTGGRLVKHARYYWLLLAESHLTRRLFGAMVRRIDLLPLPAG